MGHLRRLGFPARLKTEPNNKREPMGPSQRFSGKQRKVFISMGFSRISSASSSPDPMSIDSGAFGPARLGLGFREACLSPAGLLAPLGSAKVFGRLAFHQVAFWYYRSSWRRSVPLSARFQRNICNTGYNDRHFPVPERLICCRRMPLICISATCANSPGYTTSSPPTFALKKRPLK